MQNSISETDNEFMAAVLQGLSDLDEGREISLTEARLLLSQNPEQSLGDKRN
jgi:hypothetical protein